MNNTTLILIAAGIGIITALSIEESRDWIIEQLETAYESIGDFFSGAFDDMGEFSFLGVAFAIITTGLMYATRYTGLAGKDLGMVESMTQYMPTGQRILWTITTYLVCGIAGYFIGKYYENS